jgi:Pyridoxamine 5'-phosphate oxidase
VYETEDDLLALQDLLDRSAATAGPHLTSIMSPARRLTAEQLVDRLQGMVLLVAATVTADGRPLAGPVDGIFFRGAFHFASSPDSVRMRHLRARPAVSVTHLPAEELSVTAHGRAISFDAPRYGPGWEQFLDTEAAYVRVEADRLFTIHVTEADPA